MTRDKILSLVIYIRDEFLAPPLPLSFFASLFASLLASGWHLERRAVAKPEELKAQRARFPRGSRAQDCFDEIRVATRVTSPPIRDSKSTESDGLEKSLTQSHFQPYPPVLCRRDFEAQLATSGLNARVFRQSRGAQPSQAFGAGDFDQLAQQFGSQTLLCFTRKSHMF